MFEYIFHSYKNIYNNSITKAVKQSVWVELIAVIGIIILAILGIWFILARGNLANTGITILFLCSFSPPILTAYSNRQLLKRRHSKLNEYFELRVNPLSDLLKGDGKDLYYLYNEKSLNFLVERCDDMTGDNVSELSLNENIKLALPVITLVFGALLGKAERQELLLIAGIAVLVFLYIFLYRYVKDIFLGEDKRIVRELKRDIQYIHILLADDKQEEKQTQQALLEEIKGLRGIIRSDIDEKFELMRARDD